MINTDPNATRSPYFVGNTITLQDKANAHLNARIEQVFEPFTDYCEMTVRLRRPIDQNYGTPMRLRLYDRRFATGFRKSQHIGPWTFDAENIYHRFIVEGHLEKYMATFGDASDEGDRHSDEGKKPTKPNPWATAENEAICQICMQDNFEEALKAYQTRQEPNKPRALFIVRQPPAFVLDARVLRSNYSFIPGFVVHYGEGPPLVNNPQSLPAPDPAAGAGPGGARATPAPQRGPVPIVENVQTTHQVLDRPGMMKARTSTSKTTTYR